MPRPFTLFTGQWADLPLEEVCRLARDFGYDGLELACWGDHFEVDKALADPGVPRLPPRAARQVRPQVLGDLQPPGRPGRLRRHHRRAPPGDPAAPASGATASPEGVRQRAAGRDEGHRAGRGRLRRRHRHRLHRLRRSGTWSRCSRPCRQSMIERGYEDFADALEPDPRRLRRGGRAVRPRGPPERDRVRLLDDPPRPGGRRPPPRLRAQLRPQPLRLAGPRPGRLPLRLPRPDLPRRLQGGPQAPRRPQRPPRLPPALGRPAPRLGLRLRRARRRRPGRTSSGCCAPSTTRARSRWSGRTPAWTGSRAPRRRWPA